MAFFIACGVTSNLLANSLLDTNSDKLNTSHLFLFIIISGGNHWGGNPNKQVVTQNYRLPPYKKAVFSHLMYFAGGNLAKGGNPKNKPHTFKNVAVKPTHICFATL
jgi:hypothetical protein